MGQMGLDALRQNLSNPQRAYMFTFEIPAPIGLGDPNTWVLRVKAAEEPERSFDKIEIPFMGTAGLVLPGKEKYSHEMKVTVLEGEDAATYQFVQSWMAMIRDNISGVGLGDPDLMADGVLTEYDTKGNAVKRIKITGMYPQAKGAVPLAWENSKVVEYDITFAFQRIETMTT